MNEQAEDLTEQDVPPIEQRLLQLNQRWVGIRSSVANFKPAAGATEDKLTPTNGSSLKVEMSPPTKQKYEYAVINKNRKNQGQVTAVTADVKIDSPVNSRKEMSLDLHSPDTPTNNNSLFVVTPRDDSMMSSPSKSSESTPGSGVDVDTISLGDELSESTTSKRSTVVTDIDEAARQSSDSLSKLPPNAAGSTDQRVSIGSADETLIGEARTLLSRVGILQQQLKNSGIELDSYTHENFNSSQDLLKVGSSYSLKSENSLQLKWTLCFEQS